MNIPIIPGITLEMDKHGTRTKGQIEKTLAQLGWTLERDEWEPDDVQGLLPCYRATCGGFSTPWRATEAEVLQLVEAIKGKENAAAVGEQKARWK
jgi:hypothetical protein